eukprot:s308_g12.t1
MSAFLTLSSEEEARHCTAQLNGASFGGQVMAASPARNREGLKKAKEGTWNRRSRLAQVSQVPRKLRDLLAARSPACSSLRASACEVTPANLPTKKVRHLRAAEGFRPANSLLQEAVLVAKTANSHMKSLRTRLQMVLYSLFGQAGCPMVPFKTMDIFVRQTVKTIHFIGVNDSVHGLDPYETIPRVAARQQHLQRKRN